MKRKLFSILIAAALLCGGVAYAAGASSSDPLISLHYLTSTYLPSLIKKVDAQLEAALSTPYEEAVQKAEKAAASQGGSNGTSSSQTLHRGDTLQLAAGSGFFLTEGRASVSSSGGEVIDATGGTGFQTAALVVGHRYLVGENNTAVVKAVSDTALFFVEGRATFASAGNAVTPFTDLADTDWYYSYVGYVYQKGLMTGVSGTQFAPNTPVTRAMLATVLYRLADQPAISGDAAPFADVSSESWYAQPVAWAAAEKIVHGVGDHLFAPSSNITREQMAQMLRNYASAYLHQTISAAGDLTVFQDQGQISPWAREAVAWAVGAEILNGRSSGALDPGGAATRAEVSAVVQRFAATYLG